MEKSGQKVFDPVVFFKLCLVGYLRRILLVIVKLMALVLWFWIFFSFLGYDIDEELSLAIVPLVRNTSN